MTEASPLPLQGVVGLAVRGGAHKAQLPWQMVGQALCRAVALSRPFPQAPQHDQKGNFRPHRMTPWVIPPDTVGWGVAPIFLNPAAAFCPPPLPVPPRDSQPSAAAADAFCVVPRCGHEPL